MTPAEWIKGVLADGRLFERTPDGWCRVELIIMQAGAKRYRVMRPRVYRKLHQTIEAAKAAAELMLKRTRANARNIRERNRDRARTARKNGAT